MYTLESTLEDDNYAKVKNKDDLLVDSQPRDCWSPPREVVIFFSELCESYPEAIDDHILPLVEVEIQVMSALLYITFSQFYHRDIMN